MTTSTRDDVDTGHPDAAIGELSIPRKFCSAPVSEAALCGVRRRLSLLLLASVIALMGAYLSAAAAARGHLIVAGWLLALAVCSILAGVLALSVHARRLVRYRAEAPCGDVDGQPCGQTGEVSR